MSAPQDHRGAGRGCGPNPMTVVIPPMRLDWPNDPAERFEEIAVASMVRLLAINMIADIALTEEAGAAVALATEYFEAIKSMAADGIHSINQACHRREKYLERQTEIALRLPQ